MPNDPIPDDEAIAEGMQCSSLIAGYSMVPAAPLNEDLDQARVSDSTALNSMADLVRRFGWFSCVGVNMNTNHVLFGHNWVVVAAMLHQSSLPALMVDIAPEVEVQLMREVDAIVYPNVVHVPASELTPQASGADSAPETAAAAPESTKPVRRRRKLGETDSAHNADVIHQIAVPAFIADNIQAEIDYLKAIFNASSESETFIAALHLAWKSMGGEQAATPAAAPVPPVETPSQEADSEQQQPQIDPNIPLVTLFDHKAA